MLGAVREGSCSRAIAAVVAVALSGAPSLASALRPEPAHVCQCRAHGTEHRCACPVCASHARAQRRGALESLPPCHRAAARAALAEEEAHVAREATHACLEEHCGSVEQRECPRVTAHYVVPRPPTIAPPRGVERLVPRAVLESDIPAVPDVPPPKRT